MRKLFVIVIGSLLLCSVAGAQQTQTGSINGTVTLEDGSALPGVIVSATGDVLPKARSTVTDAKGEYRFAVLPPGNYKVTFSMSGFATEQRDFAVRLQQLSIINVTMKDATFEGEIVVTSENPTIDTESAQIKSSTSEDVIQSLPVGQQYRDLIKLIPGVQYSEDRIRGASVGASGQDNVYEFDGVGVNLPLFGTLSTQPSNHDIEEMTAVKGGANAIGFNRAGGILVNTLSKSGTNQFKGEVSYQIQTDSMTSAVDADTESTGDPNQDWAVANIGGPIIPEMLYFFASYYRPTETLDNRGNAYGTVPQFESVRDEWFGKLTFNPASSVMLNASYRSSETDQSGRGVTEFEAGSTAYGDDSTLKIAILEGTWMVTDNSFLSFKVSDFENLNGSAPDNLFGFQIADDGSVMLDVDNLDQQGYLNVPQPVDGEAAYNAFIAPLIQRYGYSDNGVQTGGGAVGGGSTLDNDDFFQTSFQIGYDYFLDTTVSHNLHIGYKYTLGEEDLLRSSNGWGTISVIGGRDETPEGDPIYYQARFHQQSLQTDEGVAVAPIHSEIKSQSIELNDVIRANAFTFNVGVIISNDKLYGQGLRAVSGNVSGFELDADNIYLMKEIDFSDMIQPRLGVTWSPNGKDALSGSYARYFPEASSLPRAASWARNSAREINAYFDADGNLIELDPLRSSSGKVFQEGIKPRSIDEYAIGYDKQISNAWTGRINGRYRRGQDFWEDTNNTARLNYDPPEGIPRELYVPNLDEIRAEIGGSSYVIAALDGAFTKYYELGAEAEWRGSKGFFRGSYVWSHYYGNFDQDDSTTSNDANSFIGSSFIADGAGRQLWNFREGNLRGDRRHQLKLIGFYQVPWNGSFGAFAVYQSGQPWAKWDVEAYREYTSSTSDTSRYAEPAGSNTTDAHYQLDLNYTQNFPIGNRFNIQLRGDVFNVTNNQTGYNIQNKFNSAGYGDPRAYFRPRRFQAMVKVMF
ncbi:MAG: carboxypeptidase-like regulatory domain-containing protein [Acidobacteriota bacterium]|nr:carboxypeptidase-like regulatory domain-containing protein [Acidobacteriota bacterium]